MTDNIIKYKGRIRQRIEPAALHVTDLLDGVNAVGIIRLDIVAKKITVQVTAGLTVTIEGSINGSVFFAIAAGIASDDTYGDGAGEHAVKWVKITRTAGSGKATIAGV